MNGLDQIRETITKYSAIQFANKKISNCEAGKSREEYYQYMKDVFSGKDNPSIDECEKAAYCQYVSEYAECCNIYKGWIENGYLFILDRRDRVVSFLYKKDDTHHGAVVHFNPFSVDLIEYTHRNDLFFSELGKRFELSKNEMELMDECSNLNPNP